jgi:hypothetical protein
LSTSAGRRRLCGGGEPMTCQRAGVRSSRACRVTCPSRAFELCALRCHARARLILLLRCGGFPVADCALVGGLGSGGELILGVAHLLVGDPPAGGFPRPDGRAGGDLQAPEFLGGQRGLLVGVERPGLVNRRPGRFDERQGAETDPRLEIDPDRSGASPDWRTLGSSPRSSSAGTCAATTLASVRTGEAGALLLAIRATLADRGLEA